MMVLEISLCGTRRSPSTSKEKSESDRIGMNSHISDVCIHTRSAHHVENKILSQPPPSDSFMNAPWLFAEAYKYRRLRECFSLSKYWTEYDVFFRQKCDTFARSSDAVFELASRFCQPYIANIEHSEQEKNKAIKLLFRELTQVW